MRPHHHSSPTSTGLAAAFADLDISIALQSACSEYRARRDLHTDRATFAVHAAESNGRFRGLDLSDLRIEGAGAGQ